MKMMCFAASCFFFFFQTRRGCIMLHPQQFRQRSDAHWCPTPYDMKLVTLSTKHKKRGSNTVPAHWKKSQRRKTCVAVERDVSGGKRGVGGRGGGEEASEGKTSD